MNLSHTADVLKLWSLWAVLNIINWAQYLYSVIYKLATNLTAGKSGNSRYPDYQVINLVTDKGTFKRIVNVDNFVESGLSISLTDSDSTQWKLDTIQVVCPHGDERDVTRILRPYFGPNGNLWTNTVSSLSIVTGQEIMYLTVNMKNTQTNELKQFEFNKDDLVYLPVFG